MLYMQDKINTFTSSMLVMKIYIAHVSGQKSERNTYSDTCDPCQYKKAMEAVHITETEVDNGKKIMVPSLISQTNTIVHT